MVTFIVFIIVLSALVLVHEAGHFFVAKFWGIRADEFGLGLPPRAKKLFTWRGTDFTLNWLPFGGFVKIFGENAEEGSEGAKDSFQTKNRGIQASVLVAGVVGNLIFAWLLLSLGFMIGMPAPVGLGLPVQDAETVITSVLPESPASEAGLKSGDTVLGLSRGETALGEITPESVSDFISSSISPLSMSIMRGEETLTLELTPAGGVLSDRPAIGVSMDMVGIVELPLFQSLWEGFSTTFNLLFVVVGAFYSLIAGAFSGTADLATLTGPVGLVGIVGDVTRLGLVHLISFTALISVNLVVINLLPFPALDGGRLLFVAIEAIRRRPISPKIVNTLNTFGFSLLIILMVLITVQDLRHLL